MMDLMMGEKMLDVRKMFVDNLLHHHLVLEYIDIQVDIPVVKLRLFVVVTLVLFRLLHYLLDYRCYC